MNPKKRYRSAIFALVSVALVLILLLPMGLKLEHTFIYHSQSSKCKENIIHFHAENTHNDFLDVYFQTVVDYSLSGVYIFKKNILVENSSTYLLNLYQSSFKSYRVRGPPFSLNNIRI